MKICLQIPKTKKYIVACSFGPDSMALLDVVREQKLNVVVAHVNYHHREESNSEEIGLKKYCYEHNLSLEILDLADTKTEGNFEAWARKIRYEFFNKVAVKYKADAVLVAHHQDDLIETYLMQKKRGNFVKKWGIAEKTVIFGTTIIRPFLSFTKSDLLEYCAKNHVPYSIDKTNLSDELERNKIRHQIIEKLTLEERTKILQEINSRKAETIEITNSWTTDNFSKLSYEQIVGIFDYFMTAKNEHRNLSKSFVKELQKVSNSAKPNIEVKITKSLLLSKSYDRMNLIDLNKLNSYELKLEQPGEISNGFITIDFGYDSEDRNVTNKDFPIKVRNSEKGDKIRVAGHEKNVQRLFIDWKMPLYIRKVWPVVTNKDNKIVYIPRYREKFQDNHKTKFVIDLEFLKAK